MIVTLLVAVIVTCSAAWRTYGVPWHRERARLIAERRARQNMLARQHEWMTYRAPPDRIVYAERADMPDRIRGGGPEREIIGGPVGEVPVPRKSWPIGSDGSWGGVPRIGSPGMSATWYPWAVLFMHHRKTPGGRELVVLVEVRGHLTEVNRGTPQARTVRGCTFLYALANPGTIARDPSIAGGGFWLLPPVRRPATATPGDGVWELVPGRELQKPFKFYAGQPDPDDLSHFTIEYEYDGQRGTIDGYVGDGASGPAAVVRLVVRDGPAAGAGLDLIGS